MLDGGDTFGAIKKGQDIEWWIPIYRTDYPFCHPERSEGSRPYFL